MVTFDDMSSCGQSDSERYVQHLPIKKKTSGILRRVIIEGSSKENNLS